MTKFLLLINIFASSLLAQYVTPGTGINWNLDSLAANSGGAVTGTFPGYTVTAQIIISANDRITILPGSVLTINGSTSGFEVNGILIAKGTETDSIVVTSLTPDSTGAYDGFRFNDTSVDSLCAIEYARIEYAYYGMRCIDASPSFKNSLLYKCRRPVQLSGSSPEIVNNKILYAYEYGILINLDSDPLIEGNEIGFNNTQATSAKNQISIGLQGNNSPIIRNNKIYGGSGIRTGGISLWISGASNFSNMIVEGNEIYNNSFGITLLSSSDGVINAVIKNNKIYSNNVNPDPLISGSGINVNGSPFNTPVITQNEIFGNWWGITIQNGTVVQAGPSPNIGNLENVNPDDDGLNIIYNNIQGTDIYDLYNNCTNEIYAQNNDWRVYDSLAIENHIFHEADDTLHGQVKFIPFSSLIPVELSSYSVKIIEGKVLLEWTTSSEKNNKGFEVQRFKIYPEESEQWKSIGFVNGKGTTTEKQFYSFYDETIPGSYLYRLKQFDFDGSLTYSDEIEIEILFPGKFELSQNYPNPFNPSTNISFQIPVDEFVILIIYDALGREVKTLLNNYKTAGKHTIIVDASGLSSGMYFYTVKAGGFFASKKMLLLK